MPVMIGRGDREGRLVLVDGELVAVLVRLDGDTHAADVRGQWFLEAGFGPLDTKRHPTFTDPEEAKRWVLSQFDGNG
ncbi:hypothetical protein [Microvirga makkahensis]|nr:hypothetical protein [Microvirga makkahensis]